MAKPGRINYYECCQKIVQEHNSEQGRATIGKTFMELMELVNSMDRKE